MRADDIRILFQDVDGCLNPEDGEAFPVVRNFRLTEGQAGMLRRIAEAVDASPVEHFVINTGRHWQMLEPIVAGLPTPKLRYCVMEHACVIFDRREERSLDLSALARRYGMAGLAERFDNLGPMRRLLNWYDRSGQARMEAIFEAGMPRLDKVGNLSVAFPEGTDHDEVMTTMKRLASEAFGADWVSRFEFCRSDRFVDILPGIHKMDGVRLLCAHLEIEPTSALAIGDYLNDRAVFEAAGRVLCPANAHPAIIELTRRKGADGYVSSRAYGGAVLDGLTRFGAGRVGPG